MDKGLAIARLNKVLNDQYKQYRMRMEYIRWRLRWRRC